MMWNNKIFRLSVILGILVIVTILQLFKDRGENRLNIEKGQFTITDTASISKIVMDFRGDHIEIEKRSDMWMIGNEKEADVYYIALLKAVMASVEVQRRLSQSEIEENDSLMANSANIRIEMAGGKMLEFSAGGNAVQTQSYFRDDKTNEVYAVNIPGYRSFVSGIFQLTAKEWQDKTIFSTPWTSLQKLEVSYPGHPEESFTIIENNGFLRILELEKIDTARMMEYVSIFSGLKANYILEPEEFDSILSTEPLMMIRLEDLNEERNNQIILYDKAPESSIQVGRSGDGQIIGFDYRNVKFLARTRDNFLREK